MGYKEVQSRRNISTKYLTQIHDANFAGNSKPSEFVNHGLLLWNQGRRKWVGNKKVVRRGRQLQVPKLRLCLSKRSWLCCLNSTNDTLLKSKRPFSRPISLQEMVGFLVDIWEQEGMYDGENA